jgi:hypothetical protein
LAGNPARTASPAGLSAEIAAAICARPEDHLLGAGYAARLARGESFSGILRQPPQTNTISAPAGLPLDQFAAVQALLDGLRGTRAVVFALLKRWPLTSTPASPKPGLLQIPPDAPFRRVLRLCGQARLPVIFYRETEWQPGKRIKRHSKESGSVSTDLRVPVITCEVHDLVALYRITFEAMQNARSGHGATLIETAYVTGSTRGFPVRESHNGSLPRSNQREITSPADPLRFLENYMRVRGLWDDNWAGEQRRLAQEELQAAPGNFQMT